ncbi:hypothetical protein [Rubripirellula reticaptiva]|uniref:Uncharacterized protein n=1 Tax=Rubripirellula reticaptiva TaxID=2528013 RepID=A0A5C6EKN7_9BACT|nr:hypothetical protein [Rubripirellula reticaptiva]TWU47879.1 hypothetical protein Poly59_47210 [Rubripirellula reticaptiva]
MVFESKNESVLADVRASAGRWFMRGLAIGMLLMAAVNALSYFFRSSDWSGLVGRPATLNSAIGFPWQVWEAGNTYGGMFADYRAMGLNIASAAVVGCVIGAFAVWQRDFLNDAVDGAMVVDPGDAKLNSNASSHSGNSQKLAPVQFSLRGLMIVTTMAAIASTVVSRLAVHPITLVTIYAIGPATLVGLAMIPHRWSWQRRVVLLIPITFSLIAIALFVGHSLQMEFDQVLMGIFLSWTPQSAVAATALAAFLLAGQHRESLAPSN